MIPFPAPPGPLQQQNKIRICFKFIPCIPMIDINDFINKKNYHVSLLAIYVNAPITTFPLRGVALVFMYNVPGLT